MPQGSKCGSDPLPNEEMFHSSKNTSSVHNATVSKAQAEEYLSFTFQYLLAFKLNLKCTLSRLAAHNDVRIFFHSIFDEIFINIFIFFESVYMASGPNSNERVTEELDDISAILVHSFAHNVKKLA